MTDSHAVGREYDVAQGVSDFDNVGLVLALTASGLATGRGRVKPVLPQLQQFLLDERVRLQGLLLGDGLRDVSHWMAKLAVEVDDVLLDGECQGCGPFDGYNVVVNIYGRDGQPMELEEFQKIPFKKKVIAAKTVMDGREPIRVLTMWDGIDLSDGEAPVPMTYSTMVMSEHKPNMCTAYPDEKVAMMGHHAMIGFLKGHGCTTNPLLVGAKLLWKGLTTPYTMWAAVINTILFLGIVVIQLAGITLSVIRWDLGFKDAFSALILAVYAWMAWKSLKAWKGFITKRREERRVEKDREEFEKIVQPYIERGMLEE